VSYFLLYGTFALWVLFDSLTRRMRLAGVLWALGTALVGPFALPIYLALRPLKLGEVREGGTAWNILKNFAILWTVAMTVAGLLALVNMAQRATDLNSEWEIAGARIGAVLGFGMLGAAWFLPTVGAALMAFLVKKNSIIETGPTGPLISKSSALTQTGGWAGIALAALLGMVVVGLASWFPRSHKNEFHDISTAPLSTSPRPVQTTTGYCQILRTKWITHRWSH
jgi:hypothetical protein